jgi:hypothetical protein
MSKYEVLAALYHDDWEFGVYFFYCSFFHESICLTPSSDVEHMLEKNKKARQRGKYVPTSQAQRPSEGAVSLFLFPSRSRRSFEFRFLLPPPVRSELRSRLCKKHLIGCEVLYTSVVTLALGFVTLTPSCLARAMMSMRLREETLWAILWW